jgi:uncharacterized membrane protein YfcA
MNEMIGLLLLGLTAGILSGLLEIGGAVVIVPALVFLFSFAQHRAEGTTLAALIPPVGILAVIPFYRHGYIDFRAAGLICAGFFVGGLFGGHFAVSLSGPTLQKMFGVLLLIVGAKLLLR